jgi:thiopurine S-methyltransferase
MEPEFWRQRWAEGRIGFHQGHPNEMLERHVTRLGEARRVLVPLCGKAVDLAYLAGHGHTVVGVELVEDAVRAFFEGTSPVITRHAEHVEYAAGGVTVFVGDYFATTPALLGRVDAVYDRAALIALPPQLRPRYVEHTTALLAAGAPGLVITLEYPQEQMAGPPFSVLEDEVRALHPGAVIELLEERGVDENPRLKELGVVAREKCFAVQR